MEKRRKIKEIQNRRKLRKRRKLLEQVMLIMIVFLLIIIVVLLFLPAKIYNESNETENVEATESTVIPITTPNIYNKSNETENVEVTESTVMPITTPNMTVNPTEESIVLNNKKTGRGISEDIPYEIKDDMIGHSLPPNASVTFDDLAYLTIPHYNFENKIVEGHLVVKRELAEEVLDIFAELYKIKYPIERMELIDKYNADDFLSIEYNNTSAFNYRESTDGSGRLSKHALGCAIDINPQINPYVNADGVGAHENAREYWSRDRSKWGWDMARAAYIGIDTEIYNIFVSKGWEWGGSWSSYRDYQHFQKVN